MGAIEKAIRDSDLGVNPSNDGTIIRVVLPAADRGAPQGVHQAGAAQGGGRPGRPSATSAASAKEELDRIVKDGEAGEDEVRRAEKELDDVTQRARRRHRRAAQAQGIRTARGVNP